MKTTIYLVCTDIAYDSEDNDYPDEVFLLEQDAIEYQQQSGGKLYEYSTDIEQEPSLYFEDDNTLNYEDNSDFYEFKERVKHG